MEIEHCAFKQPTWERKKKQPTFPELNGNKDKLYYIQLYQEQYYKKWISKYICKRERL